MKTLKLTVLLALALATLIFATGGRGVALAGKAYSWAFPTYEQELLVHRVKDGAGAGHDGGAAGSEIERG